MSIRDWQEDVHNLAKEKGWHTGDPIANIWKMLGNIHGEVSEAWEEARQPNFNPLKVVFNEEGKPEGLPVELADIMIRTMDTAEALGIDLERWVAAKHNFNKKRPHRHGGKRA